MPFAGALPHRRRSSFPDRSPQPQTAGNRTETARAFTRGKLRFLPRGLTPGTGEPDSIVKQLTGQGTGRSEDRRHAVGGQLAMHRDPASPAVALNPRPCMGHAAPFGRVSDPGAAVVGGAVPSGPPAPGSPCRRRRCPGNRGQCGALRMMEISTRGGVLVTDLVIGVAAGDVVTVGLPGAAGPSGSRSVGRQMTIPVDDSGRQGSPAGTVSGRSGPGRRS